MKKNFTLVEIMIVVAVIGLFVAIAGATMAQSGLRQKAAQANIPWSKVEKQAIENGWSMSDTLDRLIKEKNHNNTSNEYSPSSSTVIENPFEKKNPSAIEVTNIQLFEMTDTPSEITIRNKKSGEIFKYLRK